MAMPVGTTLVKYPSQIIVVSHDVRFAVFVRDGSSGVQFETRVLSRHDHYGETYVV